MSLVDEDFHSLRVQGPFATDVCCELCDGRLGGLRLIEGRFVHREPAECGRQS